MVIGLNIEGIRGEKRNLHERIQRTIRVITTLPPGLRRTLCSLQHIDPTLDSLHQVPITAGWTEASVEIERLLPNTSTHDKSYASTPRGGSTVLFTQRPRDYSTMRMRGWK